MTSRIRILRALALAALAALVFQTHVFVAIRPVRAKVVQAPIAAANGLVRVTTAGFPQLKDLRPPFALVARIKAPAPGTGRYQILFDGSLACEHDVEGGAARRVDCAVTARGATAADREMRLSGPPTTWTLEYLELATHHGNSTGALTLFVLPRESLVAARPAPGWTFAGWIALAGIIAFLPPHPFGRRLRPIHTTAAGLIVGLLAVILCSERVSSYRLVLAAPTFLIWLAVLLAPRLWTAGRALADVAYRAAKRGYAVAEAALGRLFDACQAWRPGQRATRTAWRWIALALVVVFFCAPLFVDLGELDLRSDEAIYAWAVDRILDTGDWLNPGLIPDGSPFLEKPPLKFWLVAAGVRSGVLPRNELGMRWFDALFGAVGFVYVYLIGRRLSGPLCGLTAVLVLFTLEPLVFEHGLRSNNMEAATFLSYCGGVFHFAKWVEADTPRARGHATAAAAFFLLGFMTKFVAAVFLPAVCVAAFAWRRSAWARLRSGWRDWMVPTLLVCAVVAPWFAYQSVNRGSTFWDIIVGTHVFRRFTASLDPAHLHPWHYYFVETWKQLQRAGTQWVVLVGIARLAVAAARGESWLSRAVLLWGILPLAAISLGTSKLLHYAYPFWPAIGLAAGLVVADAAHAIDGAHGVAAAARLRRFVPLRAVSWCSRRHWRRAALIGLAAASVAVAARMALAGPVAITLGGVGVGIDSVVWPLAAACALLFLGGHLRALLRLAVVLALMALAPAPVYKAEIVRLTVVDHPFRAIRDCMATVQRSGIKAGRGVYGAYPEMPHWTYYYYLWRLDGPAVADEFSLDEAEKRLWTPAEQTPVLVSRANYEELVRRAATRDAAGPGVVHQPAAVSDPVADADRDPMRRGVRLDEKIGLLLPGPFRPCLPDVLAAAGQPLWEAIHAQPALEQQR